MMAKGSKWQPIDKNKRVHEKITIYQQSVCLERNLKLLAYNTARRANYRHLPAYRYNRKDSVSYLNIYL